jgi:predicted transcriptional regulator
MTGREMTLLRNVKEYEQQEGKELKENEGKTVRYVRRRKYMLSVHRVMYHKHKCMGNVSQFFLPSSMLGTKF